MQSLPSPSASPPHFAVFQKEACTLIWCLEFCGCCQGTPVRCLALRLTGWAHRCRSHRAVTNRKTVLKQLLLLGHSKRHETQEINLSKKPISSSPQLQPERQASVYIQGDGKYKKVTNRSHSIKKYKALKNILEFSSGIDEAEERISELKDKAEEFFQSEQQKEK